MSYIKYLELLKEMKFYAKPYLLPEGVFNLVGLYADWTWTFSDTYDGLSLFLIVFLCL